MRPFSAPVALFPPRPFCAPVSTSDAGQGRTWRVSVSVPPDAAVTVELHVLTLQDAGDGVRSGVA